VRAVAAAAAATRAQDDAEALLRGEREELPA
jgi:hypothetical protein